MSANIWTYIPARLIKETLRSESVQGKRLLEPLKAQAASRKLPLNILEDRAVVNEAEIHHHEADLWHCLEGEVTFTCGDQMVNPWFKKLADGTEDGREVKAKEIAGGEDVVMRSGDWLYIPAGVPHAHRTEGLARLAIIKIPVF